MNVALIALGWVLVLITLADAFYTVVIPKTVERRFSPSSVYYNAAWALWFKVASKLKDGPARLALLSNFAPISLLILFVVWAVCMVVGFALIHCGHASLDGANDFWRYIYFSGETFFTLGYGDMTSTHNVGRMLSITEAGTGFGFLALIIGYIPVLYGHFSTREHEITLLDSRAGSDPTSGELLRRYAEADAMEDLIDLLRDWEKWSAKQLEAFLSYPVLAFYRSQHDHQSWLCSLTAILDTCAIIEAGFECDCHCEKRLRFQAQATFAMGRHVIVDLAYLVGAEPSFKSPGRSTLDDLYPLLKKAGIPMKSGREEVFKTRRAMYEPYCISLARDLFLTLPSWVPEEGAVDNWEVSAWETSSHF